MQLPFKFRIDVDQIRRDLVRHQHRADHESLRRYAMALAREGRHSDRAARLSSVALNLAMAAVHRLEGRSECADSREIMAWADLAREGGA